MTVGALMIPALGIPVFYRGLTKWPCDLYKSGQSSLHLSRSKHQRCRGMISNKLHFSLVRDRAYAYRSRLQGIFLTRRSDGALVWHPQGRRAGLASAGTARRFGIRRDGAQVWHPQGRRAGLASAGTARRFGIRRDGAQVWHPQGRRAGLASAGFSRCWGRLGKRTDHHGWCFGLPRFSLFQTMIG